MKVYKDHVFVVADNAPEHGLQVFDLTRLREYNGEPLTLQHDAHYDLVSSVHNIAINEETGFAYAVGANGGGESCGGGLFADERTGRSGTGYTHDAQCVIYSGPDAEHRGKEICFGSNETALSIADVSDKKDPVALAVAEYPSVGYTHQGWLTEDHAYFYMNDELDEIGGQVLNTRTLIYDVADLDEPFLVKEHLSENTASDHNLYITGDLMYQSNYNGGLRIFDITDREDPTPVGFFDTVPGEDFPSMNGSWSNYPFFKIVQSCMTLDDFLPGFGLPTIRWSDIDFEGRTILWRAEHDKSGYEHITPVTAEALDALKEVRAMNPAIGEAPVLPAPRNPLACVGAARLHAWWQKAQILAELDPKPGRGWHSLRRKFAKTVLRCYQRADEGLSTDCWNADNPPLREPRPT